MSNRPDPRDLAQYSYILAFASAGLLLLSFLMGLLPGESLDVLGNLVWLVLPISGIGVALALMARTEFKRQDPGKEWMGKMRTGLRINALALVFMVLLALMVIGLSIMQAVGG
jgi:hypothetical protein